jgi:hypothetical protein
LEWLSSRTKTTTNVGEDAAKQEPSNIVSGNANYYSFMESSMVIPLKLKIELPYDPVIPLTYT